MCRKIKPKIQFSFKKIEYFFIKMRLKRLVLRKTTSMHGNDKVSIQTKK